MWYLPHTMEVTIKQNDISLEISRHQINVNCCLVLRSETASVECQHNVGHKADLEHIPATPSIMDPGLVCVPFIMIWRQLSLLQDCTYFHAAQSCFHRIQSLRQVFQFPFHESSLPGWTLVFSGLDQHIPFTQGHVLTTWFPESSPNILTGPCWRVPLPGLLHSELYPLHPSNGFADDLLCPQSVITGPFPNIEFSKVTLYKSCNYTDDIPKILKLFLFHCLFPSHSFLASRQSHHSNNELRLPISKERW